MVAGGVHTPSVQAWPQQSLSNEQALPDGVHDGVGAQRPALQSNPLQQGSVLLHESPELPHVLAVPQVPPLHTSAPQQSPSALHDRPLSWQAAAHLPALHDSPVGQPQSWQQLVASLGLQMPSPHIAVWGGPPPWAPQPATANIHTSPIPMVRMALSSAPRGRGNGLVWFGSG
jgi:hypothetical protein